MKQIKLTNGQTTILYKIHLEKLSQYDECMLYDEIAHCGEVVWLRKKGNREN